MNKVRTKHHIKIIIDDLVIPEPFQSDTKLIIHGKCGGSNPECLPCESGK